MFLFCPNTSTKITLIIKDIKTLYEMKNKIIEYRYIKIKKESYY